MKTHLRFGKPENYDYQTIINQFAGTRTNSIKTSSVPLVEFWKDTEYRLRELSEGLNLELDDSTLCFEYPTPTKGKGGASMTDLMILNKRIKIAIEAKYTEYLTNNYKSAENIREWLKVNPENRKKVLEHWMSIIKYFSLGLDIDRLQKTEYQFLHRTASACYESDKAYVVYQLFYDSNNYEELETHIKRLIEYKNTINPSNLLTFFVWMIETEIKPKYENYKDNPFILLIENDSIYNFGSTKIIKI